jgi:HK97 family phage portal protein
MGKLTDRLLSIFRAQSSDLGAPSGVGAPQQWLIDALGGSATSSSIKVDWYSALQSTPIFAGVAILAGDIAKCKCQLFRVSADGGRREDRNHPIARLLGNPNTYMTDFDFRAVMVTQLVLNGNAFALIRREGGGRASSLIPVDAPRVAIWFGGGEVFYYINFSNELHRDMFGTTGALFPASEVIHVKYPISWQGLWGLSPVLMNRESIGNGIAIDRYTGFLFSNNADVGGVLKHPGKLSDPARDRLRKSWESRYSGLANRARTAILEEGLDYTKISQTAEDAQLILARKFSVLEACRILQIPPYRLADLDRTISSNIQEQAASYADNTLVPIIANFEAEYTRKLLVAREATYIDVEHDLTAFTRARPVDRWQIYTQAIQHGIYNANEIRIKEGDSPREGGDTYYYSNNMQPEGVTPPPDPAQQANQEAAALLKGLRTQREAKRANGHAHA